MTRKKPEQVPHSRKRAKEAKFVVRAPDTFGARLRLFLSVCGRTQTDFAKELKASTGFVSDMCQDKKLPGAAYLLLMRTKCGVNAPATKRCAL